MYTIYDFDDLSLPGFKLINMKSRILQCILTFIFICLCLCLIMPIYVWGARNKFPVL